MKAAQATPIQHRRWRQSRRGERGFAMAALLVAMAVMAIVMSALLPVWHTLTVREKEAELMWRGQQYDRAIQLYRKKNAAPGPPSLDVLVQGRFLRKKYKDPITNDDFSLVGVNAGVPTGPGAAQSQPAIGFGQLIGGVRSKSKARSFKEPDGATTYDAWTFSYVAWKSPNQATGAPGGGPGVVVGVGKGTGGAGGFGRGGFGSNGPGTGRRGPGQGRPPQQGRPPGEEQPPGPGPGRDSQRPPVIIESPAPPQ